MLNIKNRFDYIADAAKSRNRSLTPKFLPLCASELGFEGNDCVGVEDAQSGIEGDNRRRNVLGGNRRRSQAFILGSNSVRQPNSILKKSVKRIRRGGTLNERFLRRIWEGFSGTTDLKIFWNAPKKFEFLYGKLIEANSRVNITAITDRDEVIVKHFADCAASRRYPQMPMSLTSAAAGISDVASCHSSPRI